MTKIASLGARIGGAGVEAVDFFSERAVAEFDAAIYDLEGALQAWLEGDVYRSREDGVLAAESYAALLATLERRGRELRKFVDGGRPAVLFPSVFPALKYADRKGRWLDAEDLDDFFPSCGRAVHPASGSALKFRGPPALIRFGERLAPHFRYSGVLGKHLGEPAFLVPETSQTAGAFLCDGKRWVLTCPRLGTPEGWRDFPAAFLELYQATGADTRLPPLPAWHERYRIPGEAEVTDAIAQIEKAIAEINALLATKRAEQAELGYLKRLFTDKGPSLTKAVQTALEGLGFTVLPGPLGRDDLVATFGQAVAIVHVVGKEKAASEADASQVAKSISRYFDQHGTAPKGILVANAFRDTPLEERTDDAFPANMLGYARKRGYCLITGLQLLCLSYEARQQDKASRCRFELLDAAGPFSRFSGTEWQSVIKR